MRDNRIVAIENTKFIFMTNFSGDPKRDNFGSSRRKANLIIPTEEQAKDLADAGFKVKCTKPHEGEEEGFVPTYFIEVVAGYRNKFNEPVKYPPRIFMVCGNTEPELLTEDTVGRIDSVYVTNVKAVLNPNYNEEHDSWTLYIRTMYVEMDDDDPWADDYRRRRED